MRAGSIGIATGLGLVIVASAPALAQSDVAGTSPADVQEDASAPSAASLGDIVVTARRRQETLISVPVVVSVLSGADLTRNKADDLSRIGELTPTVIVGSFKSNAGGSIAIRGISSPANQTGFEQSVSVAIDGVQTSDGRIATLGFFDLAQVEVLKGPQALFFGKNSPAGVISITTADPGKDLEISLRGSYEFVGDEYKLEGAVSVPVSDTTAVRLAVRYRNLDGWLRNTAQPIANPFYRPATGAPAGAAFLPGTSDTRPGDDELLGRLTIVSEITPNFTAKLKLFAAEANDEGAGVATQNIGPCSGPNPRMFGVADPFGECKIDNRTTVGDVPPIIAATIRGAPADGQSFGKLTAYSGILDLDLDLGNMTLSSLTGYSRTKYNFFSGFDQTTYSQLAFANLQTNRAISEEVRLTSDFDGPFDFMLGAFYQTTKLDDTNDVKILDSNYNAAADRYSSYNDLNAQRGKTYSAFGQAIFNVTDQLELAGGLRWTRETKRYSKRNLYGIGNFNTVATNFPGSDEVGALKGNFEDDNLSPEVTLSYRPDNTKTVFVAYKTGYKSGGFGLTNPLQRATRISDVDFESEKARGFEVGAKGLFLDGRLRVNAAAFAYKFSNLQVNTYDAAAIAYVINNAGSVRQRGFELDGNLKVSDYFSLRAALAHVNARFRNFVGQCYGYAFPAGTTRPTAVAPPNCSFVNSTTLTLQQDYGGRAPARSPDWAGSAGFTFDLPVGSNSLQITGDSFYSDSYFAGETMAPSTKQDSFFRFNASVGLNGPDDRWSLRLLGRNLTNKYFLLYSADRTGGASVPGAIGEQRGVVARGREVALEISTRF